MTARFNTIVLVLILAIWGCSKESNDSSPVNTNPLDNSHGSLFEGKIIAEVVDSLSQADTESFLRARNLTVYTLYHFTDAPPHSVIIEVSIGQEDAWVDTLRKYPEVIKTAGRIGVVETAN